MGHLYCNVLYMMWSYLVAAEHCYLYDDHFMSINANMISYQSAPL